MATTTLQWVLLAGALTVLAKSFPFAFPAAVNATLPDAAVCFQLIQGTCTCTPGKVWDITGIAVIATDIYDCPNQACCDACSKDARCKAWLTRVHTDSGLYKTHCTILGATPTKMISGASTDSAGLKGTDSKSGWPCPVPAPPPPTPSAGSWPSFASSAALKNDKWGDYYTTVYGKIPDKGYPLSPKSLWILYSNVLIKTGVTSIPKLNGLCPSAKPPEGQRYTTNDAYAPPGLSWNWHPYPYQSMPASSWAEVLHKADPFGDEHFGAWFQYAPGSSIYFNVGQTISFKEHQDGYTHFGITAASYNEGMCKAAAAAGFDSIQFTAHVDHASYQCDTQNTGNAGLDYMGMEIVGVRLVGTYACTSTAGAPPTLKVGWEASQACTCDNSKEFLNCLGAPSSFSAEGGALEQSHDFVL